MKRLIYAAFALALTACSMEELPKAQVGKEPIFGTETGLNMYTNSFYNVFPSSTISYDENNFYFAVNHTIRYLTENAFSAEESGGWNWETLRNINYFIQNCNNDAVSEEVRNNYLGIARFFRAYFYFGMMLKFGDLPWVDHPLEVDDPLLYAGRDDRTTIVEKIKEDLDFAISNISTRRDESASTVTSAVAAAFKSRVCLWEGTFRKYHSEYGLQSTAAEWLNEAVSAAQYVIESGYSIYTGEGVEKSYQALFLAKQPISEEVLYATTFDGSLGVVHWGNRIWTSSTLSSCASFTRSFVNTYLMRDGSFYTDNANYATESFTEECKNRDARLSQTIRTPGYKRLTNGEEVAAAPDYSITLTGYHICKFTLQDTQYDNVDICDNNIVVFRHAEVLLNYAEAKAELGTLTDADWAMTVGKLRERAGITSGTTQKPSKVDTYLQQRFYPDLSDPTLLEIRRERVIELALEGFEWFDICRWKAGKLVEYDWDGVYIPELEKPYDLDEDGNADICFTLNNNYPDDQKQSGVYYLYVGPTLSNGSQNRYQLGEDGHTLMFMPFQKRTWNDKLYFYPIPAGDLTQNPALGQNPGW